MGRRSTVRRVVGITPPLPPTGRRRAASSRSGGACKVTEDCRARRSRLCSWERGDRPRSPPDYIHLPRKSANREHQPPQLPPAPAVTPSRRGAAGLVVVGAIGPGVCRAVAVAGNGTATGLAAGPQRALRQGLDARTVTVGWARSAGAAKRKRPVGFPPDAIHHPSTV